MSAGGSTNPLRQKMINMMYLVLTALLALNVSADILKAFALVNTGLSKTNTSYEEKNAITMALFDDLMKTDKGAAQKYYNHSVDAHNAADKMFAYLQTIKENIARQSGGWVDKEKTTVEDDRNLEVSTHFFLNEGHGKKLQDSLRAFQGTLRKCLDKPDDLPLKLDVENPPVSKDGEQKDWVSYYWEGIPSVAAITELTKLQNDIRNAESDVTHYNINKVGQVKYMIDRFEPVVSSESPVISSGESYNAKIFLGAVSSTSIPRITVNGVPQKVVNGQADFSELASGGGTRELNVSITVPNPHKPGFDTTYTTKSAYTVFAGASTVSAEKLNVLYIGLENPIAVSAAGFTPAQTFVKFSGQGNLKQVKPGHYTFNPAAGQSNVTATCFVRMNDGTMRQMGQPMTYRIRKMPKPEIACPKAGNNNTISRAEALTLNKVCAGLGENFIYDGIPCKVNSYKIAIFQNGKLWQQAGTGSALTGEARDRLKHLHAGDMLIFTDVNVTGPGISSMIAGTYTVRN